MGKTPALTLSQRAWLLLTVIPDPGPQGDGRMLWIQPPKGTWKGAPGGQGWQPPPQPCLLMALISSTFVTAIPIPVTPSTCFCWQLQAGFSLRDPFPHGQVPACFFSVFLGTGFASHLLFCLGGGFEFLTVTARLVQ